MKLRSLTTVEDDGGLKGTSRSWRISILLGFIGLAVYAIGFSTDRWCQVDSERQLNQSVEVIDAHFGLWRKCERITLHREVIKDDCETQDNDETWKPVAKVMCSVGLAILVVGYVSAILAGCYQNMNVMGFAGISLVIGGVVSALGSAVFIGKARDDNDRVDADYSVYFALMGSAVLIISGGAQLLSVRSGYSTLA
ncbi:uncharacterized protein LOC106011537 [Aplysia californica]|uniref:Uncharacterized protein LOC106011537 n=1 Tax=Aplysia californica TaxID=6500 RepID=A0ABM0ZYA8_APLCA|nr:uncharacterized protein LOC106011537 [Aplysia californica]